VLPLVAPVVEGLGFDLVWFTVLFAVCLQTSFLTPPVGFALFYLKGVAPDEITVRVIYRGVVPFILLQLVGLLAIFLWEEIVTWLPGLAYG
jgi:TRAP-type mannitol/chloroaromatic compound transport system permease large subunit